MNQSEFKSGIKKLFKVALLKLNGKESQRIIAES